MGQFRIVIDAVGGHGCQREIGNDGTVGRCADLSCPDCKARELVHELQRNGCSVSFAVVDHWYDTAAPRYQPSGQVADDLLTGKRTGNF